MAIVGWGWASWFFHRRKSLGDVRFTVGGALVLSPLLLRQEFLLVIVWAGFRE